MVSLVSLQEFLKHVLPSDGYKCWAAIKKGQGIQQGFCQSFDDLAHILLSIDAKQWNSFFACASYKTPESRKGANASQAKAFWLDIDAGQGKDYPDAETALSALDAFCDKVDLPLPAIVYSGYGIHAYWALTAPISAEIWQDTARRLKEVCEANGLRADPARTSDVASILRPVGTNNWKKPDAPKPVYCDELMPLVDTASFLAKFNIQNQPRPAMPASSLSLNAAVSNIYEHAEPAYAAVAANSCAQLRLFRDSRGNIPEPLWYAGLCVLGQCADGDELAHEWSCGHPNYTPEETARKLAQARAASGPTTCERYKALHPKACEGCPFAVTSPIALGRKQQETISAERPQLGQLPKLIEGYAWSADGKVLGLTDQEDGTRKYAVVSPIPVYVAAVTRGENQYDMGYVFRTFDPYEGWREFEIPAGTFNGQTFFQEIAPKGIQLTKGQRRPFEDFIARSVYGLMKDRAKQLRYDQMGWKEDCKAFLCGPSLFRTSGSCVAALSNKSIHIAKAMAPGKNGSLQGWCDAAQRVFEPGWETHGFALLSAFGSLLMRFVSNELDGGAILSLVTRQGGSGKSAVLQMIASAWGEVEALTLINSDTTVSKFARIAVLNNLPVLYDEFRNNDDGNIKRFVEWFTEGRDRLRANKKGEVETEALRWKNILISSSNHSLVDAINMDGYDAMSTRVYEMQLRPPTQVDLGNAFFEPFYTNRGFAGPRFVAYLMYPGVLDQVQKMLKATITHYGKVLNAEGHHRFVVRLLACNAVAAVVLSKMGLLKINIPSLMSFALKQAKTRVAEDKGFDPVKVLSAMLSRYMPSTCLVVRDKYRPRTTAFVKRAPTQRCEMRYEVAEQKLYIAVPSMKKWAIEFNTPYLEFMQSLEAEGVLLSTARAMSLGAGTDFALGRTMCWEVDYSHPALGEMPVKEVLQDAVNDT